MGEFNGAPLWGNHCWILGHDVVTELQDKEPEYASKREFRPWKQEPVMLDTKVYRYLIPPDTVMRVEIGKYRGLEVTWCGDWNE